MHTENAVADLKRPIPEFPRVRTWPSTDEKTAGKDFEGLEQVWPTDGTLPADHEHDIILVHGLHGGSLSDWRGENGFFWPNRGGIDFPRTRILSFGYALRSSTISNAPDTRDHGKVLNHAESLCSRILNDWKIKHHTRSFITFVGRGIGGLVIKEALCHCQIRNRLYGSILDRTRHVFFLDTPHHGLNDTGFPEDYKIKLGQKNYRLWSDLSSRLAIGFTEIAVDFNISSAFQTVGESDEMAVPGNTSRLNIPNENPVHMHRVTHKDIGRFSGHKDVNYKRFKEQIHANTSLKTEDISQLENWLRQRSGDKDWNQQIHNSNCKARFEGTCKWLYQTTKFREWQKNGRFLWITGPSGIGKTVICSASIQETLAEHKGRHESIAVPYLFLSYSWDKAEREMYATIALQLLSHVLSIQRGIEKSTLALINGKNETDEPEKMRSIIEDLVDQCSTVVFFLDGLNEVPIHPRNSSASIPMVLDLQQELKSVLMFLGRLSESPLRRSRVRVWCSSLKEAHITKWIEELRAEELALDESQVATDIQAYSEDRLLKIIDRLDTEQDKVTLFASFASQAGCNFRWAYTSLKDLQGCKQDADLVEKTKRGLPGDLKKHYADRLAELEELDLHDREDGNLELSKGILSLVFFARRPLSASELQGALSISISRHHNLDRNGACDDLRKTTLVNLHDIRYRCAPLVQYVSASTSTSEGFFRLMHASVTEFLSGFRKEDPQQPRRLHGTASLSPEQTEVMEMLQRMIKQDIMASACLRYLSQKRYRCLLDRASASEFRTSALAQTQTTSVNNHHFLPYAAKYWYRHYDNLGRTDVTCGDVSRFIHSPQFLTAIQTQSLFVPGHFIHNLDAPHINNESRVMKRNLPEWFRQCKEGKEIARQYESFIEEWSWLLQMGLTRHMNGEIHRCFFGALGPTHFLRSHRGIQANPSFLLMPSKFPDSAPSQKIYYESLSEEGHRLAVWTVSLTESERLNILREDWSIKGGKGEVPFRYNSETLSVDPGLVNWGLYDPSRVNTFPLAPHFHASKKCYPIVTLDFARKARIGSDIFVRLSPSQWTAEVLNASSAQKASTNSHAGEYWEESCSRGPYTIRTRRRLVMASDSVTIQKGVVHSLGIRRLSGYSTDTSSSASSSSGLENGVENVDGSISDAVSSPCEALTSASSSTGSSHSSEELEEFENGEEDSSANDSDTWSTSESTTSHNSDMHGDINIAQEYIDTFDDSSEDEMIQESTLPGQPSINSRSSPLFITCDRCPDKSIKLRWYTCARCTPGNTFDICTGCRKRGMWCKDINHQLRLRTWRRDREVTLDMLSVNPVKKGLHLQIWKNEITGGGQNLSRILFRFRLNTSNMAMLYDSSPVVHPWAHIAAYAVSDSKILFANMEQNTYKLHNIPRYKGSGEPKKSSKHGAVISMQLKFSSCGNYLFVLRFSISPEREEADSHTSTGASQFTASVMLEAITISLVITKNKASLEQHTLPTRHVVPIGRFPVISIPILPFTVTWRDSAVFVSISGQCLKVFCIPLATKSECSAGEPTPSECPVYVPGRHVVLPRSARTRPVHFIPSAGAGIEAVVVIGSRYGDNPEPPTVVSLRAESLGEWVKVEDTPEDFTAFELRQDSMVQDFDTSHDCDVVAMLQPWQR